MRSGWDLEQKAQETESQRLALESALRDSEARLAQQAEALTAERSQWDALRLELEQKAQETESQRSALESALRDSEARLAQQAEALTAERSQCDALRLELETESSGNRIAAVSHWNPRFTIPKHDWHNRLKR